MVDTFSFLRDTTGTLTDTSSHAQKQQGPYLRNMRVLFNLIFFKLSSIRKRAASTSASAACEMCSGRYFGFHPISSACLGAQAELVSLSVSKRFNQTTTTTHVPPILPTSEDLPSTPRAGPIFFKIVPSARVSSGPSTKPLLNNAFAIAA